jgi:hypothetical protein
MRSYKNNTGYKVTRRTHEVVRQLNTLVSEIVPHLQHASPAACAEWDRLRARWPSEEHLGQGTVGLSEDDLEATLAKVRRFREILGGLAQITPRAVRRASGDE